MIAMVERMSDSPDNRPDLRISDIDRDRAAEVLREAHAQGRITVDELDERLTSVYNAKTFADLVPVTRDLPATQDAAAAATPARRRIRRHAPVQALTRHPGRGEPGRSVGRAAGIYGRGDARRDQTGHARCLIRRGRDRYQGRRGDGRHRGQARPGPAIIPG